MSELENFTEHKYNCALCPYSTNTLSRYKDHLKVHSNERPCKCPEAECPFTTKWKRVVKQHVESVHRLKSLSSRPFPCSHPGCNYRAKVKTTLRKHAKIHSDEPSFFCSHPNCNYSATQKISLTYHARLHTGEKPFLCQFESCSYAAVQLGHVAVHMRIHTKEKPYKCTEERCEYSAAAKGSLTMHRLTHEPKEGEERPSFKCPLCEYKGKSNRLLSSHIKSHTREKLFKCDEPNCNFEANTKSHLKVHKLVHSDDKRFACSFESCEFRCKTKEGLSTHYKSHSEERQYKCELCPFRGKTRNVVTGHLKYVHSDPNFRPFKCTETKCNSAFKTKGVLKKHLLAHKGDKKYACSFPDCKYRGRTSWSIKSHECSIHSEEKREKCPLCEYKCKIKSSLTSHMKTHTKQKS